MNTHNRATANHSSVCTTTIAMTEDQGQAMRGDVLCFLISSYRPYHHLASTSTKAIADGYSSLAVAASFYPANIYMMGL
jgi:hypothetical protein